MGCDTCIFLNNVINRGDTQKGESLEPCSMRYGCNPYFKDGHDNSIIVTESYCATCQALDKECQCESALRAIRTRKRQLAKNNRW
jgi:hypothetical protein